MQKQDWNIKARSEVCQICEKPFEDGAEFNTVLSWKDENCLRTDICAEYWDDEKYRPEAISIWRNIFRLPLPEPEEPLKKETSETLLRKLMETEEDSRKDVIFVLAVDLERRRIFEERDVELLENGEKRRIYEHKKTGEIFIIHDPDLDLQELEDVQGQVLELLLHQDGENSKPEEQDAGDEDGSGEDA